MLLVALLLAAEPAAGDDLTAAALRPSQRKVVEARLAAGLAGLPRYEVDAEVDAEKLTLRENVRLDFVNSTRKPLTEVPLKLYPNAVAPGRLEVKRVRQDGAVLELGRPG